MTGTRIATWGAVWVALAACGLTVVGCGGDEKDGEGEPQSGRGKSTAAPAARQSKAPPEGMKELHLKLPRPKFKGTPTNIRAENLETPRKAGVPRPTLLVPEDVTNVALGRPVAADTSDYFGDLECVTDGDKEAENYVELGGAGRKWVQIDLGGERQVFAIVVWHFHGKGRSYRDVVVQVAAERDFIDPVTVFNNDHDNSSGMGVGDDLAYVETNEGKLIDARGVRCRYVRLHSNGFDDQQYHELNHYTEVEVYGKPTR
jgi:hypothetical protein